MSITLNTVAFNRDRPLSNNKLAYISSANTFSNVDQLTLGSIAPKSRVLGEGVAQASVKRTKGVTLSDATTLGQVIVDVTIRMPVGVVEADVTAALDDVGDFLISAGATDLAFNQDIDQ